MTRIFQEEDISGIDIGEYIVNDASNFSISETHSLVEDKETYMIDTKVTIGTESYTHNYLSIVK